MGYLSRAKKWSWLQKDALLSQLTPVKNRKKSAYLKFVSMGESQEVEKFYSLKNLPSILGSSSFKDYIKDKFFSLVNRTEIPESKELALDPEKVISCVCRHFKISRSELLVSKRGTENLAKDIAIYLVRVLCCKTLPHVGKEFEIKNYSTVSSAVQRVKSRVDKDKKLKREIETIREKTTKGQKRT